MSSLLRVKKESYMAIDLTFPGIIITIVSLVILWVIVSIPVWIAGKAITGGKASFVDALLAVFAGQVVYYLVTLLADWVLTVFIGSTAFILGYVLAIIAWICVYKACFRTGWIRTILIAVLAWILIIVLTMITGILFGVSYPSPFFPPTNIKLF